MKLRMLAPLGALCLSLAPAPAALAQTSLTIKPASHAFGKVAIGAVRTTTFTVKNTGTTRSAPLQDAVSGPGASAFSLGRDSCNGRRLAAGAGCRAQLHFSPSSAVSYGALYTASEAGGASVQASLSGSGKGAAPATLQITPYSYAFRDVVATGSGTQTFTLQNTGGSPTTLAAAPLVVDGAGVPSVAFSVENDSCANATLAAGASCTFDLRFSPVETSTYTTSVQYFSTDSAVYNAFAQIDGFPLSPIALSPSTLSLPDTALGANSDLPLTVTNVGGADITPTFYQTAAGFSSSFGVSYIDYSGDPNYDSRCQNNVTVLHPGDSCIVNAFFIPQALGFVQDQMTLSAHRPSSTVLGEYTSAPVTVSGTGVAGP